MVDAKMRALEFVARCDNLEKLGTLVANARRQGEAEAERAASLRLYEVKPAAEPNTFAHDVWRSVLALKDVFKSERGWTTMFERARQRIARDGEARTVADLIREAAFDGIRMLVDRRMVEHTFEAVVLRHPDRLDPIVLAAARERLR